MEYLSIHRRRKEASVTKIAHVCLESLWALSAAMGKRAIWGRTVEALQTSAVSNIWTIARPQSVLFPTLASAQTENTEIFDVSRNFVKSMCFGLSLAFESSCGHHTHEVVTCHIHGSRLGVRSNAPISAWYAWGLVSKSSTKITFYGDVISVRLLMVIHKLCIISKAIDNLRSVGD
jgi:hypothetical protein